MPTPIAREGRARWHRDLTSTCTQARDGTGTAPGPRHDTTQRQSAPAHKSNCMEAPVPGHTGGTAYRLSAPGHTGGTAYRLSAPVCIQMTTWRHSAPGHPCKRSHRDSLPCHIHSLGPSSATAPAQKRDLILILWSALYCFPKERWPGTGVSQPQLPKDWVVLGHMIPILFIFLLPSFL